MQKYKKNFINPFVSQIFYLSLPYNFNNLNNINYG